jgi:hypothetical protein
MTTEAQDVQIAEADRQAIELIRDSGVLNPNATLDKVMQLTLRMVAVQPAQVRARHTDTFIHSHFIYKHEE